MKKRSLVFALYGALCSILLCNLAQAQTVYLFRHFEKQTDVQDPELTRDGQQHAEVLAKLLRYSPIKQVLSTEYRRTIQSAQPLANQLGIAVESYDPRAPQALIERILQSKHDIAIAGHSNTIPDLVTRLGGHAIPLEEKDYGYVFVVDIHDDGEVETHRIQIQQ